MRANPSIVKQILKYKIGSYNDESAGFHDKEIPKVGSCYAYLAVVLIDFVLKNDEEICPQVFFKKCNYIKKEKQWWLDVLLTT